MQELASDGKGLSYFEMRVSVIGFGLLIATTGKTIPMNSVVRLIIRQSGN